MTVSVVIRKAKEDDADLFVTNWLDQFEKHQAVDDWSEKMQDDPEEVKEPENKFNVKILGNQNHHQSS